jgi:hypothetical protein
VSDEAGFATPAAATISLALGIIATAVVTASVTALKLERSDYERVQTRYALEGAQAQAALDLMGSHSQGPVTWQVSFEDARFEAIAEPELTKLSLKAAAKLPDAAFARWGVRSPSDLKSRLAALATLKRQVTGAIAPADTATTWRLCARSAISAYGMAAAAPTAPTTTLALGGGGGRTGQLWRIRLAAPSGWVDDRIVRFTGSMRRPVAVPAQWFGRGAALGDRCSAPPAA